jgi:hypothetical protein
MEVIAQLARSCNFPTMEGNVHWMTFEHDSSSSVPCLLQPCGFLLRLMVAGYKIWNECLRCMNPIA